MPDVSTLLDASQCESWLRTGATLVVDHLREAPIDGQAATTVTATLTGVTAAPGGPDATAHSRGKATTVEHAVAAALQGWSFGRVRPLPSVPVTTCPHAGRVPSGPADVVDLVDRLDLGAGVDAEVRRRTRSLTLMAPDGEVATCRSSAWRMVLRPGRSGSDVVDLVLVDTSEVIVDALRLEVACASAEPETANEQAPPQVLVAPGAALDLWCSVLDHAYARGLEGSSTLRPADTEAGPPGASCFDVTGRRPAASRLATIADETAVDGAATAFLPGLDVPSRLGAVAVPRAAGTAWERPGDATVLVGCHGLAPAGLMSGHNLVLAPSWVTVRDGAAVRRWSSEPVLVNLPRLVAGVMGRSDDGTWRQGLVQTPGSWWTLGNHVVRPGSGAVATNF